MESSVEDGKYILPLSELHQLYSDRLQDFGIEKEVNRTRLKFKLMSKGVDIDDIKWFKHCSSKHSGIASNTHISATCCFQLKEDIFFIFK